MDTLSKSDMYLASREALIRLLNGEIEDFKTQITNLTVREAHAADTIIQLKIKAHEKLTKTVGYQQKILKQLEEIDGLKKKIQIKDSRIDWTVSDNVKKSLALDALQDKYLVAEAEINQLKGTLVYAVEASAKADKTIVQLDVALQKFRHMYPKGFNGDL